MIRKYDLAAGCLTVAVGVSAAEQHNLKLGLWEVPSIKKSSALPPMPKEVIDRMTPQQRAQMEAALKAQSTKGGKPEVDRECITPKDLERPFEPNKEDNCEQTLVSGTRTSQEIRMVCTGENKT